MRVFSLARVARALSVPGAGLFMMCLLDAQVRDHCATIEKPLYREKQLPTVCPQFCNIYFFFFCSFYRLLLVCELYFVDMRPALSYARKLRVLFLLIALSSFLIIVYEGSILMISDHGKYYFCRGRAGYSRFQVTGMIEWGQKSKLQKIPGSKIDPRKIPCRIFQYTMLNDITRNLKTLEIE